MSKVRAAAGVIPWRPDTQEVLLVQRGSGGRFFPGYHAFPGGAFEDEDGALAVAAARELFEETGLWLGPRQPPSARRRAWLQGASPTSENAGGPRGRRIAPPGSENAGGPRGRRAAPPTSKNAGGLRGRRIAPPTSNDWQQLGAEFPLELDSLLPAGIRTTPEYAHWRFRAQFYLWVVPPQQEAEWIAGELDGLAWWPVEEALRAWREGSICLAPPTQASLLCLSQTPTPMAAARQLQSEPEHTADPIPVRPGLAYVALESQTLAPARHTLCFLLGEERPLVIDPGSSQPEQLQRLLPALSGRRPEAVILSHHHPDHAAGWQWCRQQGWPIWCQAETASRLQLEPDRLLDEGQWLGNWQVLHTPGHASGHLAFWQPSTSTLIACDLVSSLSTILVAPPDGDMSAYLHSLERCRALNPRLVLSSHGGPMGPGSDLLGKTLQHRQQREGLIVAALGGSFEEVLQVAYQDVSGESLAWARLSLQAHLQKLLGEGRAQLREGRWCPA